LERRVFRVEMLIGGEDWRRDLSVRRGSGYAIIEERRY
jgi:hypothetical protein